jgi:hypothetical protein
MPQAKREMPHLLLGAKKMSPPVVAVRGTHLSLHVCKKL